MARVKRMRLHYAKIIGFVSGMLLAASSSPFNPADAIPDAPHTIIQVTTESDEYGEGGLCSLREAIQSANTDSDFGGCVRSGSGEFAVIIPAGTYNLTRHGRNEDANQTGDLDIRVPVALYGAGKATTIIQGDGDPSVSDRVFHIVADPDEDFIVTMWDLAITNGYAPINSDGGGVLNEESLWISRVAIYGNTAYYNSGGGVASMPTHDNQGFQAYLSSSITDNLAGYVAGGIYVWNGELLLDHVDIARNSAYHGGGLYLFNGSVDISYANIYDNSSQLLGGGILLTSDEISLEDSSIYANTAGTDGGNLALVAEDGAVTITRCYVGDGQAPNGVGGGIYQAHGNPA
jgi:CSLREA domain-containing protein